jgi:DNA-directed RNA polymerase specialized sigma24 family protein
VHDNVGPGRPAFKATRKRLPAPSPGASWADLEEFHRQYFLPLVWRATYKHGLSKEDAKDVVQEAFIVAIAKLRNDGNPRAWLNQVVDHLSINHQRKATRRAQLAAQWGLASPPVDRVNDTREEENGE